MSLLLSDIYMVKILHAFHRFCVYPGFRPNKFPKFLQSCNKNKKELTLPCIIRAFQNIARIPFSFFEAKSEQN
jgi:hypothetical protein